MNAHKSCYKTKKSKSFRGIITDQKSKYVIHNCITRNIYKCIEVPRKLYEYHQIRKGECVNYNNSTFEKKLHFNIK